MSTCLIVICDGRDQIHQRALASAEENLPWFDQVVEVDDRDHALGYAGAIRTAWAQVEADWVFHFEADFLFKAPVPVGQMIRLIERRPYLRQVALKRQAWNPYEKQAGGVVELDPDVFIEQSDQVCTWTEHRRFFTTNPSVYPAGICRIGWPHQQESEGYFTYRLLVDPLVRFAYWGPKLSQPLVEHIGLGRRGTGY